MAVILLAAGARAAVQTLEDMGITPVVTVPEMEHNWTIPYEFKGNCTAFFNVKLVSGTLRVIEGNKTLLYVKKPGSYRVVLKKQGVITLSLRRQEGEARAEIDGRSFIACDRVPVVEIERRVPRVWSVGGFTKVEVILKNMGTAPAKGTLDFENPWNAAPIAPRRKITVPPGESVEYNITFVTAKENPKVLFPGMCFEYRDRYGPNRACIDSTTFRSEKNVPLACTDYGKDIEVFNKGYLPAEVNGEKLMPRDHQTYGKRPEISDGYCATTAKIEKMPFKENRDTSVYISLIWTLLGILGVLTSEKRLKTSKA